MVLSAVLFAVMTSFVRSTSFNLHPVEIAFFRYLFGLLALAPLLLRPGAMTFRTGRFGMHFVRALCGLGTVVSIFAAVAWMPMADATALSFTSPFFVTIGAALILGEVVLARRWVAVVIGLIGAMVILRPGVQALTLPAVLAIASAVFLAGGVLAVKSLSRTESAGTIVFYQSILITVMLALPAAWVWTTPSASVIVELAVVGITATLGHLCYVRAYAVTDTSVVAPFDFFRLIFTAVLGFMFFAESPDLWTWLGAGLIFFATIYGARTPARPVAGA
jgi:drug/metabolite transporter (DMT)-like permease